MVKIQKELTHIYHNRVYNSGIAIGAAGSVQEQLEILFEKSLVLTSDLKRLPYLLGGKLYFWFDSHIMVNIVGSALTGVGATAVLLNGTFESADFVNFDALISDEQVRDEILLIAHAHFNSHAAGVGQAIEIEESHWDFEGKRILYDTLTLMIFIDCDTTVGTANFPDSDIGAIMELEIDWTPINKAEMMEFLTEHIYAKQGD